MHGVHECNNESVYDTMPQALTSGNQRKTVTTILLVNVLSYAGGIKVYWQSELWGRS